MLTQGTGQFRKVVENTGILFVFKRRKHKNKSSCTAALDHFDTFYKSIYKKKWPSVRLGLLSQQKKIAVINNFGDVDETENFLKKHGAFDFKLFLEHQKNYLNKPVEKENLHDCESEQLDKLIVDYSNKEIIKDTNFFGCEQKSLEVHVNNKIDCEEEWNVNEGKNLGNEKNEELGSSKKENKSLHHDLNKAEFQEDRIILPDSNDDKSALHEFVPATKLRGLEGYILESEYYKYYQKKSNLEITISPEPNVNFPNYLNAFSFDRGEVTEFLSPSRSANNVLNYFLMDGAELLPVLVLDIQNEDNILNISYNSIGTAFCILQSLNFKSLVCSGEKNVYKTFSEYLYDYSDDWKSMLYITAKGIAKMEDESFNKILVDAPCTDDKSSLFQEDNNIFSKSLLKNRIQLPEVQSQLLSLALKKVRPGGTVVYTTSTLSPVQNDGVVNEALKVAWEETRSKFSVKDLSPGFAHMALFYNFGNYLQLKYGTLIVPFVPANFGPRYLCKIVKSKTE